MPKWSGLIQREYRWLYQLEWMRSNLIPIENAMPKVRPVHLTNFNVISACRNWLRLLPSGGLLSTIVATLVLMAAGLLAPHGAVAADIAAIVNGEVVTDFQIKARRQFLRATTGNSPSRQVVLEQLIEEKLKVSAAKQNRVVARPGEVRRQFADVAKRNNMTVEYLERLLRRLGTTPQTMHEQIRAEISWRKAVRASFDKKAYKYQADFATEMLAKSRRGEIDGIDFTLRPVIVVVPKSANNAQISKRRKVAEAIRKGATSCADVKSVAKSYRDVVVRSLIIRSSHELGEALADQVKATPVGAFTPVERTSAGFAIYGVCKTRILKSPILPGLLQRTQFMSEKIRDYADDYLAQLKSKAVIERR